jgi:hypothetical protein
MNIKPLGVSFFKSESEIAFRQTCQKLKDEMRAPWN